MKRESHKKVTSQRNEQEVSKEGGGVLEIGEIRERVTKRAQLAIDTIMMAHLQEGSGPQWRCIG